MQKRLLAAFFVVVLLALFILFFVLGAQQKPAIVFDESGFVQWSPVSSLAGMNMVQELPQPGFICYSPAYISVGDMNIASVDLNQIYVQSVEGGFVVKVLALPSPCYCGDVENSNMYVFVDSTKRSSLIKEVPFGEHYVGVCAN